jgi:hypothetical protein
MQHVAAHAVRAFREALSLLMFTDARRQSGAHAARTKAPKTTTHTTTKTV